MTTTLTEAPTGEPNTLRHNGIGPMISGIATTGIGVAGVGVGLKAIFGELAPIRIGWWLPLIGVQLDFAPLGGLFMVMTGVRRCGRRLLHRLRQARALGRRPAHPATTVRRSDVLVPAAGSVTTFLLAWELMAIASLVWCD